LLRQKRLTATSRSAIYYLAKIHEKQGDPAKARENFQRFFDFWKEGDIDRALVEEARIALEVDPR
jgi:cytochrome c-type biogenesis protein CcmH/NrfG